MASNPYLILPDFKLPIQDLNLQQIISNNPVVLAAAIAQATEEAKSYLRQKFDCSAEFAGLSTWNYSSSYQAASLVYLNPPAYNTGTSYTVGEYTLNGTIVYICTANTTGTFNAADWSQIGLQYDIYNAILPYPLFQLEYYYKAGDQVFWKGKTYTCLQSSEFPDHEDAIQYAKTYRIPPPNVFPDDPVNGVNYWGNGVNYSVPANTPITNVTYWAQGDTRDADIVQKVCDIALYHLHARISPQNIPKLREHRYKGPEQDHTLRASGDIVYPVYSSLGWLQACARGSVTPSLPLLQPSQGNRIRWGSNVKNINSY